MRIASLSPSATEILFASGAGGDVAGVPHECDYPPGAAALPALASGAIDRQRRPCARDRPAHPPGRCSSLRRLDERLLGQLRPGLIVTQGLCAVCAVSYATVSRAARGLAADVPVLSLELATLGDSLATAATADAAAGHQREAGRPVASMRARTPARGGRG